MILRGDSLHAFALNDFEAHVFGIKCREAKRQLCPRASYVPRELEAGAVCPRSDQTVIHEIALPGDIMALQIRITATSEKPSRRAWTPDRLHRSGRGGAPLVFAHGAANWDDLKKRADVEKHR
jgi:hypothetical protein